MSGNVLMQKVKNNGFDPKLSEPGNTMYTFRDTQGGGGGQNL